MNRHTIIARPCVSLIVLRDSKGRDYNVINGHLLHCLGVLHFIECPQAFQASWISGLGLYSWGPLSSSKLEALAVMLESVVGPLLNLLPPSFIDFTMLRNVMNESTRSLQGPGVILPFDCFVANILKTLGVAPSQLHPNAYSTPMRHLTRVSKISLLRASFALDSKPFPLYWRLPSKFKGLSKGQLTLKDRANLQLLEELP
ncbi:hypothetical protein CR513_00730, partial [Mucuna pruriens]